MSTLVCQVRLFVLSRLLSSLWVSRTGSASDWCALQEALYKFIDTIQYNTLMFVCLFPFKPRCLNRGGLGSAGDAISECLLPWNSCVSIPEDRWPDEEDHKTIEDQEQTKGRHRLPHLYARAEPPHRAST